MKLDRTNHRLSQLPKPPTSSYIVRNPSKILSTDKELESWKLMVPESGDDGEAYWTTILTKFKHLKCYVSPSHYTVFYKYRIIISEQMTREFNGSPHSIFFQCNINCPSVLLLP